MKKNELIEMVPVILLPYYMMLIYYLKSFVLSEATSIIVTIINVLYYIYSAIVILYRTIVTINDDSEVLNLAKMNLILKAAYFPAEVMFIIFGIIGLYSSSYELMLTIWAFLMFILFIFISGIMSLSTTIKIKREKLFSKFDSFIFGLAHFVFIFDLIACIYCFKKVKKIYL